MQIEHGRCIKIQIRGRSQTTFTAMGGGGARQMSTLLNKYGKFY